MSNSKLILNKAKNQAAQLAKDVVKSGAGELLEIPKQVVGELVGVKTNQPSPIVEAMQETSKSSGVTVSGLKQVEQIEEEMKRLRKLKEDEEEKSRQPVSSDETPRLAQPGKPILPSSPSRGPRMKGPGKALSKFEAKTGKN
ncbi:hypothetical protein A2V80_00050 [Candidatus Woesebacteria bacterium RBG_16_39_8b]|uniref:Uncharacterized protein n=1 Tax=Candidatus Woesebacteria bacterium RBG_16_39_8b TaxID=1802482 RepID=A0A1F7XC39_9BACT|nr:MAG: hypothetical protein A2V80_00050 [Candidatus Woesebacteria bacterium RBG_16_39_8b]